MPADTWTTVRQLVSAGHLSEALRLCAIAVSKMAPELHNRALLLSGRLAHALTQERDGLVSDSAAAVERNRVAKALLGLVVAAEALNGPEALFVAGDDDVSPSSPASAESATGPSLFLSYCRDDYDRVVPIASVFRAAGFLVHQDTASIAVGSEWNRRIEHLIATCDYFALCQTRRLSERVFTYVHQETSWALEKQAQARPGTLFILPLQLDAGPPIDRLAHIQHRKVETAEAVRAVVAAVLDDFKRR
jgi:hypothetical protein